MTTHGIRHCDEHGYFAADSCPDCSNRGTHVLDGEKRRSLSQFLSGALRHFPDDANLSPDANGWVDANSLIDAARERYDYATPKVVAAVVSVDPKGRYDVDGNNVRAAYGHSIDVTLDDTDDPIPDTLYHGTPKGNLDDILDDGIRPMTRQHVHLAETVSDAENVGYRHSDNIVVLAVDTAQVMDAGYTITKRGNVTYTTKRVPSTCVSVL